eukprot:TRINITY_DN16568_c0_g1_i2.p1 TRINITY_DN16568_c0_g1~~TRINITY_DN16568_c0_g1_i2.p1  ORF type:complete len:113 (-),score=23.15 TRINITY_DN16568_c0_g1_i2:182-520(-)
MKSVSVDNETRIFVLQKSHLYKQRTVYRGICAGLPLVLVVVLAAITFPFTVDVAITDVFLENFTQTDSGPILDMMIELKIINEMKFTLRPDSGHLKIFLEISENFISENILS